MNSESTHAEATQKLKEELTALQEQAADLKGAGPEVAALEALAIVARGGKPPDSLEWADPRAINSRIQQGSADDLTSKNWAILIVALIVIYIAKGWRLPRLVVHARRWVWDWLERYFSEPMMHSEFGSRIYGAWIAVAVGVILYYLRLIESKRESFAAGLDVSQLDRLISAASAWIRQYLALVALCTVRNVRGRYTRKSSPFWLSVLCGNRSMHWRSGEDYPGRIEREYGVSLLQFYESAATRRRMKNDGLGVVWAHVAQSFPEGQTVSSLFLLEAWDKLASYVAEIKLRPGFHFDVYRWAYGGAACVVNKTTGRSTAGIQAISAKPGGQPSVLYSDSGRRQQAEPSSVTIVEMETTPPQLFAVSEREGVIDERVHQEDAGVFEHIGRNRRRMLLRDAEYTHHWRFTSDTPADKPKPEPSPDSKEIPESIRWAVEAHKDAPKGLALFHLYSIIIQTHEHPGDIERIRGHVDRLHTLLERSRP